MRSMSLMIRWMEKKKIRMATWECQNEICQEGELVKFGWKNREVGDVGKDRIFVWVSCLNLRIFQLQSRCL